MKASIETQCSEKHDVIFHAEFTFQPPSPPPTEGRHSQSRNTAKDEYQGQFPTRSTASSEI